MCGGREGVARSCARVFAHVVGARIAVSCVVCMCVCRHAAGSREMGADAAPCSRAGYISAGNSKLYPEISRRHIPGTGHTAKHRYDDLLYADSIERPDRNPRG